MHTYALAALAAAAFLAAALRLPVVLILGVVLAGVVFATLDCVLGGGVTLAALAKCMLVTDKVGV